MIALGLGSRQSCCLRKGMPRYVSCVCRALFLAKCATHPDPCCCLCYHPAPSLQRFILGWVTACPGLSFYHWLRIRQSKQHWEPKCHFCLVSIVWSVCCWLECWLQGTHFALPSTAGAAVEPGSKGAGQQHPWFTLVLALCCSTEHTSGKDLLGHQVHLLVITSNHITRSIRSCLIGLSQLMGSSIWQRNNRIQRWCQAGNKGWPFNGAQGTPCHPQIFNQSSV